jgi:ABC-2 type transport system ATP-binding protein
MTTIERRDAPEAIEPAPAVSVRKLGKIYAPWGKAMQVVMRSQVPEPVAALTDVSLEVFPGEACVIVGPNGAGKSTLFRVLTGLTTPTTGSASVMGFDVDRNVRATRRLVGFMPADDRSLGLRHTCWQNLSFHGRLQGMERSTLNERIDETLDMVGLLHARDRAGVALSSGMRARLQLARALLHRPKVLILDEPTGTIDPVDAHRLLELIQRLTHEQQLAVLISSHRLEEIDALSDNVAFLDRGHLLHWGTIDSLRAMWETPRADLQFSKPKVARRCADRLREREQGIEATWDGERGVVATVPNGMGELLAALGSDLVELETCSESRMPLRAVLARLVSERGRE